VISGDLSIILVIEERCPCRRPELKIKVNPEDFQVEEILARPLVQTPAAHRVYRLRKRNWNTVDALSEIARSRGVELRDLHWCGRKDRSALTVQYFSTSSPVDMTFRSTNLSAEFAGFSDSRLGPGSISGNRFRIVLRDLDAPESEVIGKRLEEVKLFGFANYFDDQRFGDVSGGGVFPGEMIVKRRYGEALKCIFTAFHPGAPERVKARKAEIASKWGNWKDLSPLCPEPRLRGMLEVLTSGGSELEALGKLPREEMSQYLSSYQSFLWNLLLEGILKETVGNLLTISCRPVDLLQYRDLPREVFRRLAELVIPTPAAGMPEVPGGFGKVLSRVLYSRGVRLSKLRLPEIHQAFLSSFGRRAISVPEELKWGEDNDRLFPGRRIIYLEFILQAGSYATMLIKSVSRG
jgi:tRNA pseudouridine13 synthase